MPGRLAAVCVLVAIVAALPATAEEGFVPLLDDQSFASWTHEGESKADFQLRDGIVSGQPIGNEPKNAFLCSPRPYEDFELRFAFRITPDTLNSGVQFRSEVREDGIVAGPQLEMETMGREDATFFMRFIAPTAAKLAGHAWQPRYWAAAGVYGESLETGWLFPGIAGGNAEDFEAQGKRLSKAGDWNEVRLEAIGARIRTWLAGEPRADYEHEATAGAGLLCLQVHGGEYEDPSAYEVEWKDLEIRER